MFALLTLLFATKDINCLSVTSISTARNRIIGLLVQNWCKNGLTIDPIYLRKGVWRLSIYLYCTWPRNQIISYYVVVYFLRMKARTSLLVKCFPIHGFLVQQQVHSQPIWSCKMQRKNITVSVIQISLLAGDSLNIFYVACKTLLTSQSVSISPMPRAPYNTWRPQLPTRSMSVGELIFFSVTGMNFEYIPVNIRPIHQYL